MPDLKRYNPEYKIILLDSCVYFRLSLLNINIFEEKIKFEDYIYEIKVNEFFEIEFYNSNSLQSKFNLTKPPPPQKKYIVKPQKNEVERFEYILENDIFYALEFLKNKKLLKKLPSTIDKQILAIQLLRPKSILVCSDDSDIQNLAGELDIRTITGSELCEIFLANKTIDIHDVIEYFKLLKSINDFPGQYRILDDMLSGKL